MPQRDVVNDRGWKREFEDPIPLPRGRQLVTLKDAADYIMKLPKAEQGATEDHERERQRELAKTTGKSLRMLNCKQTQ
jgi:hypothetical protein